MQAIILAAGMGKRLGELTKERTKCMIEVNGVCLIDRLLGQLAKFPMKRIILVIGYQGEKLCKFIGDNINGIPIEYVYNPIYDKTNNIYSLYLAKEQLQEDDTLLMESDIIFEDSLLDKVVNYPFPNIALVDHYEMWMDGTMVQLNEEYDIVNFISKKAFRHEESSTYYKTVNIYKFSQAFSVSHYVPFLEAYSKALGNNEYYEQVLRVITLLDHAELKGLPLEGELWYEIDDIQDLDIAETLFAQENQLSLYQKRYGGYWRFPRLKDFCYLVNPYFPSVRMKEEMKANFDTLLCEYPSGMFVNSLIMAKNIGLKQEYVIVGNGASELIKSLMEGYDSGKIGMVYPTFEEYLHRYHGDSIVPYVPGNENFDYNVWDLMNYYEDNPIDTLLLINPDNPSGNYIPKKEVLVLLDWAKAKAILLIVDESFVDFTEEGDENSLLKNEILEKYKGLIVIKSISKSYGVPGLRLGLLASSDVSRIEKMKKDVAIWNINSFAEFYLQIYGKYEEDYREACRRFKNERERFFIALQEISYLRVISSQANYFLCNVLSGFTSKELAQLLLDKFNILIKDCADKVGFEGRNYIRIAVRDEQDNRILVNALKTLSHENNRF